jgi:hypothetical protein
MVAAPARRAQSTFLNDSAYQSTSPARRTPVVRRLRAGHRETDVRDADLFCCEIKRWQDATPTVARPLLEAAPGFEPGNKRFAGARLTTWLCRHPVVLRRLAA